MTTSNSMRSRMWHLIKRLILGTLAIEINTLILNVSLIQIHGQVENELREFYK